MQTPTCALTAASPYGVITKAPLCVRVRPSTDEHDRWSGFAILSGLRADVPPSVIPTPRLAELPRLDITLSISERMSDQGLSEEAVVAACKDGNPITKVGRLVLFQVSETNFKFVFVFLQTLPKTARLASSPYKRWLTVPVVCVYIARLRLKAPDKRTVSLNLTCSSFKGWLCISVLVGRPMVGYADSICRWSQQC